MNKFLRNRSIYKANILTLKIDQYKELVEEYRSISIWKGFAALSAAGSLLYCL